MNIPTRQNNPGDLKDPQTGQLRTFNSPQEGWAALTHDISSKMQGATSTGLSGNSTLQDFSHVWAPASDNNDPVSYANNLASQLGGNPNDPISKYSPSDIAMAVAKNEGYQGEPIKTYSAEDFGKMIQQKYTQYGSLDPVLVAQKVAAKYPQYKGLIKDLPEQAATTPQPQDQEPSLGQKLSGRLSDVSENISDLAKNISGGGGSKSWISDILQTGGAVAGGLGDVVQSALELVPGYKAVENVIGESAKGYANTDIGKQVISSINNFRQNNPELSDDIGSVFNIATALPILRGLGALKDVAITGASKVLKNTAEKGVGDDLQTALSRTKTLTKAFNENGGRDTIDNAIKQGILPDISGGRYATEDAYNQAGDIISKIEEGELQPALAEVSQRQSIGQSLSTLEQKAIQAAENDTYLKNAGAVPQAIDQIKKRFSGWKYSFGDNINLQVENNIKRGVRTYVNWNTPEGDADAIIGSALQKDIEDVAAKNGFENVADINKKMGDLIKYQKMLKSLDQTPVKTSLIRSMVQRTAGTVAGAAVGHLTGGGLPAEVIGGIAGEKASGLFGKKAVGGLIRSSILKGARKSIGGSVKRLPGLLGATLQNRSQK